MPITPADLLDLSRQLALANAADDECVKRCVVSRAYYAALHAVDETFPKAIGAARIAGESSHAEIIGRALAGSNRIGSGRSSARTIANMMPRLRRSRNDADYKLSQSFNDEDYSDVVDRVARVLTLCMKYADETKSSTASSVVSAAASADSSASSRGMTHARPSPPMTAGGRPSLKRVK